MTGVELAREVLAMQPELPVLVVSGTLKLTVLPQNCPGSQSRFGR
jgi:hypothetical protein